MKEYKGIKYKELSSGKWKIQWPSGLNAVIEASNEEHLFLLLDQVINNNFA